MKISRKLKTVIICTVYVLVIIIQISTFTPYIKTETYISTQNVPHTVVIDRGYTSFENADGHTHIDKKGVTTRTQINYKLFVLQFALTTTAAVFACYLLYRKKLVVPEDVDASKCEVLKKQNIHLQQTIDRISSQNDKLIIENKALCDQNHYLQTLFDKVRAETGEILANDQLSLYDVTITEPPCLDVNGLSFTDEETVQRIQKKYAEDLYIYIRSRLDK